MFFKLFLAEIGSVRGWNFLVVDDSALEFIVADEDEEPQDQPVDFVVEEKDKLFDEDKLQPVPVLGSLETEEQRLRRSSDVINQAFPGLIFRVIAAVFVIGYPYF